ncbi:hypothetical protein CN266_26900 [Bacillus cereus]|uniref:hypothetical protein n=1 Tax=Bacillus cereus TaxID=1396 RepID=UPI000BF3A3EA|nr:hypothetical protein [Bacillus cereus]PFC59583.1 hypothetical protein CN266_26900 [Bacillus cereus]
MSFPWYEEVTGPKDVTQGDILKNFPVPVMIERDEYPFFVPKGAEYDVIVMTQACDLENGKVDYVTLCPVEPLENIIKTIVEQENKDIDFTAGVSKNQQKIPGRIVEKLKKGEYLNFYLLNKHNGEISENYRVVILKQMFQVPFVAVQKLVRAEKETRVRLLPPYREHLAQAYANTFSRIGLPLDIKVSEKVEFTDNGEIAIR